MNKLLKDMQYFQSHSHEKKVIIFPTKQFIEIQFGGWLTHDFAFSRQLMIYQAAFLLKLIKWKDF
jgi:hypothetical protein